MKRLSSKPSKTKSRRPVKTQIMHPISRQNDFDSCVELVSHDESLLERSRTQWQFGDWESLTQVNCETLRHHPHRGEIAVLAAAGHARMGNKKMTRKILRMAREWGSSEHFILRIFIAGVYSTFSTISTIAGDSYRATQYCETAIAIGSPNNDRQLLAKTRMLIQNSEIIPFQSLSSSKITAHSCHPTPQDPAYYMYFPLRMECKKTSFIGFTPDHNNKSSIQNDTLVYETNGNTPLYFISNDSGDFNVAPKTSQIFIYPNSPYLLSGRIEHSGEKSPVVWIFQYADGKIIAKQSIPLDKGNFQYGFKTSPDADSFALGLRLLGAGTIDLRKSLFRLQEQDTSIAVNDSLEKLRIAQQRTIENAMKQIEACVRLQHYLGPETLLPDMHNWPISPDFGVLLIQLIEDNDYDAVIEFGSGTSTLILAKALQRTALRGKITPAPLVSFDHLEKYRDTTYGNLKKSGLLEHAHVVLGELRSWINAKGTQFQYYACEEALCFLRQSLTTDAPKLLIIVDGPPAATGKHARYPALPIVTHVFGDTSTYHFVMDDYLRGDEREIVALWKEALASLNIPFNQTDFSQLEKQACLLEVLPKPC